PFFAGFGAFMFVYALLVQGALGWSSVVAGLALTQMAGTFLTASLLMPRVVVRWGRSVVTAGAALQFTGLVGLGLTVAAVWPHVGILDLAPWLAVAGFGQGWVMPSLIRIVLSDVPVASAGVGSGVLTTTQQVSLAVGVAGLGSLFLALAGPDGGGTLGALLTILAVQSLVAAGIVVGSSGLPGRDR